VRKEPWGKVASELEAVSKLPRISVQSPFLRKALADAGKTEKHLFGEKFTILLQEADLTYAEAAEFLHTPHTRINFHCTGIGTPSALLMEHFRQKAISRRQLFE